MGYDTKFNLERVQKVNNGQMLEVEEPSELSMDEMESMTKEELIEHQSLVKMYDALRNMWDENTESYDDFTGSGKWYDCEEDIISFSLKYPQYLFTISGEGDDNTDLWMLYVCNGRSEQVYAKIIYPDPDFAKLIGN